MRNRKTTCIHRFNSSNDQKKRQLYYLLVDFQASGKTIFVLTTSFVRKIAKSSIYTSFMRCCVLICEILKSPISRIVCTMYIVKM